MIYLVYAVIPATDAWPRLSGVAGERLQRVAAGRIAVVVGALDHLPATAPPMLRRYDAVMNRLADRCRGVLPARFGTRVGDLDELRDVVAWRGDRLRRALAHVAGRRQMTIRLRLTDGPMPAPAPRVVVTGADYLRARAAAAAAAAHVPGFDPIRAAVRRWVRDERVEKRAGVASVYHLVPAGAAASYAAAAERAARQHGLSVTVSGPFAAYAFTETW